MNMRDFDAKIDAELAKMFARINGGFVEELLRGNDAQCFSTEQFIGHVEKRWPKKDSPPDRPVRLSRERARRHLLCLPHLIREVSSDVWAAVEKTS